MASFGAATQGQYGDFAGFAAAHGQKGSAAACSAVEEAEGRAVGGEYWSVWSEGGLLGVGGSGDGGTNTGSCLA